MLPQIEETYDIVVNLGSTSVNLTTWKGKDISTITLITNEIQEVDNLSDKQLEGLVLPYIENYNGTYYTRQELIFMLYKLRSASLGEDIEFSYVCQSCNHSYNESKNLLENAQFTPGQYDVLEVGGHEFKLEPTINREIYEQKIDGIDSDLEKLYIEMLLRMSQFNYNGTTYEGYGFDELKEYIKKLNISLYNEIIEGYLEKTPNFVCVIESTCPNCQNSVSIDADIIPAFFSDL